MIGSLISDNVNPVETPSNLLITPMSPACNSLTSSCSFPLRKDIEPILTVSFVLGTYTFCPLDNVPENNLTKFNRQIIYFQSLSGNIKKNIH